MPEPDTNPYAPPSAELHAGAGPEGRRRLWKAYFVALALLLLLLFPLSGFAWMQPLDVLDLLFSGVGLCGLYGYAFRRALGGRGFWRVWLPFEVAWDLTVSLVFEPAGLAYRFPDAEPVTTGEALVGYVLILPLYFALFRYAHRSPELWRSR